MPVEKLTLRELQGIVPALPGRITIDFEDQIEEAMEEDAYRIVAAMRDSSPNPDETAAP